VIAFPGSWAYRVIFRNPRAAALLFCVCLACVPTQAESLRGVVYFNEIGNGANPGGTVKLLVGGKLQTLSYGGPLERNFRSKSCDDIGAIWSVEVYNRYIGRATCDGQVDRSVHDSWLVVVKYLEALPLAVSNADLLSNRYRSSLDFRGFLQEVDKEELQFFYGLSEANHCVSAVHATTSNRVHLIARCPVELRGKSIHLLFDVIRESDAEKWMIDGIQTE